MTRTGWLAALAALAASASLATAQDGGRGRDADCLLDRCGDRSNPFGGESRRDSSAPRRDPQTFGRDAQRRPSSVASGDFDFYVLALSWSPTFCATGGAEKSREQCDLGARNAFVVHGLWPQFERGFPSDCDHPARNPPRAALEAAKGVYPDEGLARYQWRKHGTCSGRSPAEYFADVRRARDMVATPAAFEAPRSPQQVSPLDVQRAFLEANRNLRPGMLGVTCRRGMLEEVRICLSKDLRTFRPCPEVARNVCRTRDVTVPPVR